jgi:hypothetical protein
MRWGTITWVLAFSVAMGFLEAAVVVYLRELYYPEGFDFPLKEMDMAIMKIELLRELATMIMLLSVGFLAASKKIERLAYFVLAFAVWDIFYYVFLKFALGWPESLLTWDILFLLPVTWVGPVVTPIINSITMILLCMGILYYSGKGLKAGLTKREWILFIVGAIIVIFAYIQDYSAYMLETFSFWDFIFVIDEDAVLAHASLYIPRSFNWYIFSMGQLLFFVAIALYILRLRKAQA